MTTQQQIDNLIQLFMQARHSLLETIVNSRSVGMKTYANQIMNQVQREIERLAAASDKFIETAIPSEYKKNLDSLYRYFKKTGLVMSRSFMFAQMHADAVYVIAREMQYQIQSGLATVGRQVIRYIDVSRAEALRSIGLTSAGENLAAAAGVAAMKKEMVRQLQTNGFMTIQYGDPPGRQVPIDVYARMVARSTAREAANTARLKTAEQLGYDLVRMSSHSPTCDICAPAQGRVYSVSGKDNRFPYLYSLPGFADGYRNMHPNCFIAGTLVRAGGVIAHFSRNYVGEIITINISSGDEITVTPNHPILTADGWVAAGDIKKGQKIAKCVNADFFISGKNPNNINVPTAIENVPKTLVKSCSVTTMSMKTTAENFHGDGIDGEVAVIHAYGFLRNEVDSVFRQKIGKLFFIIRLYARCFFNALRTLAQIINGALASANGIMRRFSKCKPLFRCHSGQSGSHSVRTRFGQNSDFLQTAMDDHFCDTVLSGNVPFGHSAVVECDNFVNWKVDPGIITACNSRSKVTESQAAFTRTPFNNKTLHAEDGRDLINSLAGNVELFCAVEINRNLFDGHVFNLQTESGWYVANNIITHNCRHVITPTVETLWTTEEREKYLAGAEKPIDEDTRSRREIDLYHKQQAQNHKARAELYQFERYKERLGDDAPNTLQAFSKIKSADGEKWAELQAEYRKRKITE